MSENKNSNKRSSRRKGRRGNRITSNSKKQNNHQNSNDNRNDRETQTVKQEREPYSDHWTLEDCLKAYADGAVVRGTLRVLPFSSQNAATTASFIACDRGLHDKDICIPTELDRNRALDGDVVFVELYPQQEDESEDVSDSLRQLSLQQQGDDGRAGDMVLETSDVEVCKTSEAPAQPQPTWQDDPVQADLWNPLVPIARPAPRNPHVGVVGDNNTDRRRVLEERQQNQRKGRVVGIVPPKPMYSEVQPSRPQRPTRRIVGSLKVLKDTILLTPNNRSLPQFRCPTESTRKLIEQAKQQQEESGDDCDHLDVSQLYFQAEYEYGSWKVTHRWPPCTRIQRLGTACVLEDEIQALLMEFNVDHGDFAADVLKDVNSAVQSGVYREKGTSDNNNLGWKPTSAMYKNRRDYRSERIFTIDPTTAKDLDDALHIRMLDDGSVEIGVHIADVSHFVRPGTAVDREAQRRSTTVYLVDRTVPMLPRPLCEVACSLNEGVERLAFSCVWRQNLDGTLRTSKSKRGGNVWYGRSVIKSCARLDYATAQNIIENKVATGESEIDETLWPKERRPLGGHTVDQVAADVRLMHRVAMARRRLRFENGALGLHGIKLTFQLDSAGQTPLLTAPYPIRDSNRLVEEFMLLANYLVAQRLITHAGGRALLRCHNEPQEDGLAELAAVAKAAIGFDIDISSSQSLHDSLVRLGRECSDPLVLQCLTHMLMTPMVPADYFAAGLVPPEEWRHFALNIPYYTHFTSPIRRYPDVLVHRLLQATIDGPEAVDRFQLNEKAIDLICKHSNDKRMNSKKAQERCDRVFLSLFVKDHPIEKQLGVVLSVGKTSFTVLVASLGVNALLYLEEHRHMLSFASEVERDGTRRILLQQKPDAQGTQWGTLEIKIFTKVQVTLMCKDRPPVDVKLRLEGPWTDG